MWAEKLIAGILHISYNSVNVLVYYFFIPLSWAVIIDMHIGIPVFSSIVTSIWIYIFYVTRGRFNLFCDLVFRVSQVFLLKFRKIGWNYIVSSVIICVLVPALVYIGLLSLL